MKVRKGSGEEIPLVQGKEQRLRFVGAAVKRYPTPKVRETQVSIHISSNDSIHHSTLYNSQDMETTYKSSDI